MFAIKNVAVMAYTASARAFFPLIFLAGCSVLPQPPSRPALYDFGPGPIEQTRAERRMQPLPPLTLDDIEAPGVVEESNTVLYRLAYVDAQQLRPYSQARWNQPPAMLFHQRLRERLGQHRAVLRPDNGAALARSAELDGRLPPVLRVELEEFSQIFTTPTTSAGVIRVRATVVDLLPDGETLRGQQVFTASVPARTADAPGGVAALAQASTQVADEVAAWLEQTLPQRRN